MPQGYIQIFKGSSMEVIAIVDALDPLGIFPVIKKSFIVGQIIRFWTFGYPTDSLLHRDEEQQAVEVLNALDL